MEQTKTCKECGATKPILEFYKNNTYADGYTSKCKKCILAYHRQYQKDNKEKLRKKSRERYQKHKVELAIKSRENYLKHKKERLAKAAEYRKAHREQLKQYFRDRYKANSRQILDSRKEYNEAHREERKIYLKTYYRKNKERLAKQNYERQKRRIQNDSIYKLKRQIGLLIWRSFNQRGYVKPAHSEKILGCKLDEFTAYLKQSWLDKYGVEWIGQPCHIDHIVPLATAKTKEDVIKLCHYTNLRLLTPEDNMQKSDSLDYAISNNLITKGELK